MRLPPALLVALLVLPLTVAAAASGRTSAAAGPCRGTVVAAGSYVVALRLGARMDMYLPDEVRERNIKKGQVMLGGAMAMIDRVPPGTRIYDLQVRVCTSSGAVVTQLKPKIVLQPAGEKARNVAVAMMAEVGKGLSDYHYGNDVTLKPGSRVTVTVTFKGNRAVLRATVPKPGSSGSGMDMG
jgi:hypothetical protein